MLAFGMVDQAHHPKRPVLHSPKSQGATPLPVRSTLTAERRTDKRFELLLRSDANLRTYANSMGQLEGQLESRRELHAGRYRLHLVPGGGIGLGAGIIERRGD